MSMQRRCEIIRATDNKWYVILGCWEYANDKRDCSVHGGFLSEERAIQEIDKFPNPGGWHCDNSGTVSPAEIYRGSRNELYK